MLVTFSHPVRESYLMFSIYNVGFSKQHETSDQQIHLCLQWSKLHASEKEKINF